MKNKIGSALKTVALQSSMICFGITLVTGILLAVTKNYGKETGLGYTFPISIALCSILSGCAVLIFNIQRIPFILQCVIHFLLIVGIVTGTSFLFGWTDNFYELLIIYGILVVVYVILWALTYRSAKKSADAINKALESKRDSD